MPASSGQGETGAQRQTGGMETSTTTDRVTVYWRPGCGFCHRLFTGFDRLGIERTEVNIWEEPGARAHLRTLAGGTETVPTVVVGDQVLVNPRPEEVVALLELGL